MKQRTLILAISVCATLSAFSISNILADLPPPPPPPPPSPRDGAISCPDTLSKAKLGQLLRNGIKAGVLVQKEGLSEEEVISGMMSQKAPTQGKTETKQYKQAIPKGQENMGGAIAEIKEAEAQGITVLELRKRKKAQGAALRQSAPGSITGTSDKAASSADEPATMKRDLRSSSPGKLESTPDTQPAWMKKLKEKKAAAANPADE